MIVHVWRVVIQHVSCPQKARNATSDDKGEPTGKAKCNLLQRNFVSILFSDL